MGNSPNVKAKSGEVIAGIESLLSELGAGPSANQGMPAGVVSLEEAPAFLTVIEEPVHAEPPVAEEPALEPEATEETNAEPALEPEATEETNAEPALEPEATESEPVE
jgi:hypothetical protein